MRKKIKDTMRDAGTTRGFTVTARASIPSTINGLAFPSAIVVAVVIDIVPIGGASAATASFAPHLPCHFRFRLLFSSQPKLCSDSGEFTELDSILSFLFLCSIKNGVVWMKTDY